MNFFKLLFTICMVTFLFNKSSFAQSKNNEIIGVWKLAEFTIENNDNSNQVAIFIDNVKSLIAKGATYEFKNDNTIIKSSNRNNIYHYQIVNNKIILKNLNEDASPNNQEQFEYIIENGKLIFSYIINEKTQLNIITTKIN